MEGRQGCGGRAKSRVCRRRRTRREMSADRTRQGASGQRTATRIEPYGRATRTKRSSSRLPSRDHVNHDSGMLLMSTQARLTQRATLYPSLRLYLRGVRYADRVLEVVCQFGRWRRFGVQAVRDIAEHRVRELKTVTERLYAALYARKSELQRQGEDASSQPTSYLAARDQLARPLRGHTRPLARSRAD